VEKPIGHDLESSKEINDTVASVFNDDAIKASVEEVTRAIGVNFQANAQDVTLSLVSYNGDKSVKTLTISAPFG
jgi:hypothetical protein